MKHFLGVACGIGMLLLACSNKRPEAEGPFHLNKTLISDGIGRTYLLRLPADYYRREGKWPLVIGLHGGGGSANQFERHYGLTPKATGAGFITVYADGVQSDGILGARTWNAGQCCDYAMRNAVKDVQFISHMIDSLIKDYHVDPARVFVTGMSNGAMMAYRLACEIPDKITAIAPVAGAMHLSSPCGSAAPVPVMHIHSEADRRVPHLGGTGIGGYDFPPVREGLDFWASTAGCGTVKTDKQASGLVHITWSGCRNDVRIEYFLTSDGGHSWPGGERVRRLADEPSGQVNANEVILSFFSSFRK